MSETLHIVKNKYGSITVRQQIKSSLKVDAVYHAAQIKVRLTAIAEQLPITGQELVQGSQFVVIFSKAHQNEVGCQPV